MKAIQALNQEGGSESGIVLPNDLGHMSLVKSILPSMKQLDLKIYFVDETLNVSEL
ncbi:MAG: hypothetical protein ABIH76_05570 [Candidatus Bathyarchaeota archaeon]